MSIDLTQIALQPDTAVREERKEENKAVDRMHDEAENWENEVNRVLGEELKDPTE